jgi:hypothetical protein
MRRIPNAGAEVLTDFVLEGVQRGAEVHTDAWKGYNHICRHPFRHVVTNLAEWDDPAHVVMPEVHHIASLLKRWLAELCHRPAPSLRLISGRLGHARSPFASVGAGAPLRLAQNSSCKRRIAGRAKLTVTVMPGSIIASREALRNARSSRRPAWISSWQAWQASQP